MPGKLYAASGSIQLFWMSEDDRNDYERLLLETPEARPGYKLEKLTDLYWDTVLHGGDFNFMIYDDSLGYCGNVSLQHSENDFPEIGIELFKECRNKGIAPKAISLMVAEEQKYRKKAAYLVRIAVNNEHCRHVFEKMGAVLVGFDSRDKEQIDALEQRLNEEKLKKNKDAINYLQRSIDYYTEKSKNICEYKLYTSSICD